MEVNDWLNRDRQLMSSQSGGMKAESSQAQSGNEIMHICIIEAEFIVCS